MLSLQNHRWAVRMLLSDLKSRLIAATAITEVAAKVALAHFRNSPAIETKADQSRSRLPTLKPNKPSGTVCGRLFQTMAFSVKNTVGPAMA
jgi:hypothetical protein